MKINKGKEDNFGNIFFWKKPLKLKNLICFFQIRTSIYLSWVFESFLTDLRTTGGFFTSFLCPFLAWVLFLTLICQSAHFVWRSTLFCHAPVSDYFFSCSAFTKNNLFFIFRFRTKSLFCFHDWISRWTLVQCICFLQTRTISSLFQKLSCCCQNINIPPEPIRF